MFYILFNLNMRGVYYVLFNQENQICLYLEKDNSIIILYFFCFMFLLLFCRSTGDNTVFRFNSNNYSRSIYCCPPLYPYPFLPSKYISAPLTNRETHTHTSKLTSNYLPILYFLIATFTISNLCIRY